MLLVEAKNLIRGSLNHRGNVETQVNTVVLFLTHFLTFALLPPPYFSLRYFLHGHKMDTFAACFLVYIKEIRTLQHSEDQTKLSLINILIKDIDNQLDQFIHNSI